MNKLNISFNMEPQTLDARKSGDLTSCGAIFLLFNGLMQTLDNNELKPALAESYKISQDQKTYIFYLRKNAKWSDGHKITAYDFEKSWKKVLDPSFPSLCPQLFYPIKNAEKAAKGEVSLDEIGINALDEHILVVNLTNPTPFFLSLTSFCAYFPVPSHIIDKDPNWENHEGKDFICNGPFILKKWKHNNELILEKNPLYWNAEEIKLNQINIHIIENENTALQMYENNQLDWVGAGLSPLPFDSIAYLKNNKELSHIPVGGLTFCAFNTEIFPFNNQKIRKAFGFAINRKAIVENITQGNETIATRCIPQLLMNNKNISLYEDNNPTEALELFNQGLKELNITKDQLKLTFFHGSNILHKKQAEALQEQWSKVFQILIKLEQQEDKMLFDKLYRHQFHFALTYLITQYNDAQNIFDRFKNKFHCKNYPQWENNVYIDLLNYSATLTNPQEREQILEKAESILINEMPIAPIYHHSYVMLTKPYIKGLYVSAFAQVYFDKIYFSQNENKK